MDFDSSFEKFLTAEVHDLVENFREAGMDSRMVLVENFCEEGMDLRMIMELVKTPDIGARRRLPHLSLSAPLVQAAR